MKKVHDYFSHQSENYKLYRPSYPNELYSEILKFVSGKNCCWDCGTGNGQVAVELAKHFTNVVATDISQNQLDHREVLKNIVYKKVRAERTTFPENKFDLITVAQAIHWFDIKEFYKEVVRVAKDDAVLAVWGYGLLKISTPIDSSIGDFYKNTIGSYWNTQRKHVDNAYNSIPFNFKQLNIDREMEIKENWDLKQLEGYLNTWSGVKNYINAHKGKNPVPELISGLRNNWKENEKKVIRFPIFLKVGRVEK